MKSPSPLTRSVSIMLQAVVLGGIMSLSASAQAVSAIGRVLPQGGIIDVYGTPGDIVVALNVEEGQAVKAGQSLATLSSLDSAEKKVEDAQAEVTATREIGDDRLEIGVATLATAELEEKFAIQNLQRAQASEGSAFMSSDLLEQRTLTAQQATLAVAQAELDLKTTQRLNDQEMKDAQTALELAEAELEAARVLSPIDGTVLKVRGRVGNQARGGTELFKLGNTEKIIVVAEVYETEVIKVKPGMAASINAAALPEPMTGVVSQVSGIVFRNTIETMDPTARTQTRVVEVTIEMDAVEPLNRLIFMQVDVRIDL
jgi:HlyD family secretion protein